MKNVKITDLTPRIKDKELANLLPSVLHPYTCEFELHGVNNAIANAIRRVMMSELPAAHLTFDITKFKSTDPFHLVDFIRDRVALIPILQTVDPKATFRLAVVNESETPMTVKSSMFEQTKGAKTPVMNETFDICTLGPKSSVTIDNIYIIRQYGYEHAASTIAFNVAATALDVEPYDEYTKTGVPSSVSDPRKYRMRFTSNGVMPYADVFRNAVREIVTRLEHIAKSVQDIHATGNTYTLTIRGETDTTGNLIVKTIADDAPSVTATYTVSQLAKTMTLTIRTDDDIESVLLMACNTNIKKFNALLQ